MPLPNAMTTPASLKLFDGSGRHRGSFYAADVSTVLLGFVDPDNMATPKLILWTLDRVDALPIIPYVRQLRIQAEPLGGNKRERTTATTPGESWGELPLLVGADLAPTAHARKLRRYWVQVDDDEPRPIDAYGVRIGWSGADGAPRKGIPLLDDGPLSFRDDDELRLVVTAVAGSRTHTAPYWWAGGALVQ